MRYKYSEKKHNYELVSTVDGLTLEQEVDNFIESHQHKEMIIQNDDDYSALKKQRTLINNKCKEITAFRKQTIAIITGDLKKQSMALEKKLAKASDEMTERLNEYKGTKPKVSYSVSFECDSQENLDKIIKYAKRLGIKPKEDK